VPTDPLRVTTELGEPCDPCNALPALKTATKRARLFLGRAPAAALCYLGVMLSAGMPAQGGSVFGHASVAITGDIYGHVSQAVSREALTRLSNAVW
jgi:hypothetical protein